MSEQNLCVECLCCDAQAPVDAHERIFLVHPAQFACDAVSAIEPYALYIETRWPALDGTLAHYVPRVGLAALEYVHVASAHADCIEDFYATQWTREQLFLNYEMMPCDVTRANVNMMLSAHGTGPQHCFVPVPLQFVCVPDLRRDALRVTVRLAPHAPVHGQAPPARLLMGDVPVRLRLLVQYRANLNQYSD